MPDIYYITISLLIEFPYFNGFFTCLENITPLYMVNVSVLKTNATLTKAPCKQVEITNKYSNMLDDLTTTANKPNSHVNTIRLESLTFINRFERFLVRRARAAMF